MHVSGVSNWIIVLTFDIQLETELRVKQVKRDKLNEKKTYGETV
jgi:hypothetical protein